MVNDLEVVISHPGISLKGQRRPWKIAFKIAQLYTEI
jgi:hypothetical protein